MTVLIFSKDRALQLEGLLSSLLLHCRDVDDIEVIVIFTCSDNDNNRQYQEVKASYRTVAFLEETDFCAQVKEILRRSSDIIFLVDDTLFVGDFSTGQLKKLLESYPQAVGVSLRLGQNTVYCYPLNCRQPLPDLITLGDGFFIYEWPVAVLDFAYPLEISSSCYRSGDIWKVLGELSFNGPNELEGLLAANSWRLLPDRPLLLCPERTLAFSVPVNVVQTKCANRFDGALGYDLKMLSALFDQGQRIDVERFSGFVPGACHQPVEYVFKMKED
ncbi:MAG: glycosyltransferase involved in cell wall biosis-like protein [Firmicutes bacterium]|nr:glycosyltransferase involved in cell wall biosis-like protein [Bacillota bacterium]